MFSLSKKSAKEERRMFFDPSNADYRRRGAIIIADPLKVFAFISSLICALLLLLFIWVVWPTNPQESWPRPAASLLDLNALSMRGASDRRGLPDTFHGVLAIDTAEGLERRNWSYITQHFALLGPGGRSYMRPSCQLRTDFALQLPF
jgi:hypothetical protein